MINELQSTKVGLKMNMKETKVMSNNQLERQITTRKETLDREEANTYLGQTLRVHPAPDKRTQENRDGMELFW